MRLNSWEYLVHKLAGVKEKKANMNEFARDKAVHTTKSADGEGDVANRR